MFRTVRRLLLICFFTVLTVILHLLGRFAPELIFEVYPTVSQNILQIIGGFFSVFPVAMWELLALLGMFWLFYSLVRDLSKAEAIRWITGVALCISIGIFSVTLLWGLNIYSPPMHEKLALSGEEYSLSHLKQAAVYYRDKMNACASNIQRDGNGEMIYDSFNDLAQEATDSYMLLAVKYDCFRGPGFTPKEMIMGNVLGVDGIFIPFTGEACVSADVYSACLPFVMCKQIGVGNGFTDSGESDFAAFLACDVSDSPQLRYSGYFNAFSTCYNALYAKDPQAAREVWQGVAQSVRVDCAARLELETGAWRQAMLGIRTDLWDLYGETFRNDEGESPKHDSAADLLTMWYIERIL